MQTQASEEGRCTDATGRRTGPRRERIRAWGPGTEIVPDASLSAVQLRTMSQEDVWSHFAEHTRHLQPLGDEWLTYDYLLASDRRVEHSGDFYESWEPSDEVLSELLESPTVNIRGSTAVLQEAA